MDRSRYRPLYLGALALGVSLFSAGTLVVAGSLVGLVGLPDTIVFGALLLFLTAIVVGPTLYRVIN